MKLINADEIYESHIWGILHDNNAEEPVEDRVIDYINSKPTFDLDNVIAEIRDAMEETDQYRHNFCGEVDEWHCARYENCETCMAEHIIEILKSAANATNGKNGG